ncbi:MAG: DUF5668 domain-containing protein [Candidatus Levyibacteriota bacterium]|jgi:hypothetical protein
MVKETKETDEQIIEGIPVGYYHKKHSGESVLGLVILFIGILFLFNNLGLVPWSVWNGLWKFWPVIIILIGIKMFAGRSLLSRILLTLLLIFVFAGVLAYILYYYGVFATLGISFF